MPTRRSSKPYSKRPEMETVLIIQRASTNLINFISIFSFYDFQRQGMSFLLLSNINSILWWKPDIVYWRKVLLLNYSGALLVTNKISTSSTIENT